MVDASHAECLISVVAVRKRDPSDFTLILWGSSWVQHEDSKLKIFKDISTYIYIVIIFVTLQLFGALMADTK